MSRLDDLHTLVRLLKEFDLPVSPIMEYAIKEKEEELSQTDTDEYQPISFAVENTPTQKMSCTENKPTRTKSEILRVLFPDGSVAQYNRAIDTYVAVIEYGDPEKIHNLNIIHAGVNIVDNVYDPQYSHAQRRISGGWLVFTNTSTRQKKQDLVQISDKLGLGLKVDLISLSSGEVVEEDALSVGSTRQKIEVIFPSGLTIRPNRVFETIVEVVKYAGPENVHNLNIIICGDNLVLKEPRPRYVKACKSVGNGWFVNTCSDTQHKYEQIRQISDDLNLGISVRIIEAETPSLNIDEATISDDPSDCDEKHVEVTESSSTLTTINSPDDITLEVIQKMVDWDKEHNVLEPWKQKAMRDIAYGRREYTENLRYAFYLNWKALSKKGFHN